MTYKSAILDVYDVYQFETYMNGFLDLEYPNLDFMTYKSAILDFYDVYQFETYMNGFLDLEYPNLDHKHGFPSCIGAEIISFCQIIVQ